MPSASSGIPFEVGGEIARLADQTWRGLDVGRKELLLPLATDERLREGAQHVSKFNLTHASTRQYVAQVLRADGRSKRVRLTVPHLVTRVQKLHASLAGAAVARRLDELRSSAEPAARAKAADELEKLRDLLTELARSLRKR